MGSAFVRRRRVAVEQTASLSNHQHGHEAFVNGTVSVERRCGDTGAEIQENGTNGTEVVLRRPSRTSGQFDKSRRHSISTPGDRDMVSATQRAGLVEDRATAAYKLRLLLQQLDKGDMPSVGELQKTLSFAADVLSQQNGEEKSGEDNLLWVRDKQVRAWLSTTFTTKDSRYLLKTHALQPKERFKAVANTIMISNFMGNMYRETTAFVEPQYPEPIADIFQALRIGWDGMGWIPYYIWSILVGYRVFNLIVDNIWLTQICMTYYQNQLDSWDFDIFRIESLSQKQTLRFVGYEIFKRHDLFKRCEISQAQLDCFLSRVEAGYGNHGNLYHNATHGADVTQTVHYLIHSTGFESYLSPLEILAILLAAIIHDVDHPGTSNSFQITERSEFAMLYNDRAVLENHHLYFAFMVLNEDDCNFLKTMKLEDFRLLRKLVIDMVLATDMSLHFEQLKHMRLLLSAPDAGTQLLGVDRSKIFCMLLHMADISHPGKPWQQHYEWTERLCEEFFCQGDREKKLGRSPSPLCDRENTNIPEGQIGFIDFIVAPSYKVCQDMLELCLSQPHPPTSQTCSENESHDSIVQSHDPEKFGVWEKCLTNNREMWQSKCKDTEETRSESPDSSKDQNDRANMNGHCSDHSDTTSRDQTDQSDASRGSSGRNRDKKTERVECKKHSQVEVQTINTVETLQTPGGSETKTLRTVEYCKVTTNEATLIQSQCNHQESN